MFPIKPLLGAILAPALALSLAACGGDSTSYTVTTSAGEGGAISPAQRTVNAGQSTTFSINPLSGYRINQVSGCNGQLSGRNYEIAEVTQDCQVNASFEIQTYAVTTEFNFGDQQPNEAMLPTIDPESVDVLYNQQQTFELRLPDDKWTFNTATGCPVSMFRIQAGTNISITTRPILRSCTLELDITPPDPNKGYEISADIANGNAYLEGPERPSDSFSYGEQVQIDLQPVGERDLIRFTPSATNCEFQQDGTSVTITVLGNCHFSALFLAEGEHNFASNSLLRAFRDAQDLAPEDHLTEALVAAVDSVDLFTDESVVLNLDGIQAAQSLTSLAFRTVQADLAPLTALPLTTLKVEKVEYNGPLSLEPLKTMPLRHLQLTFFEATQQDYDLLSGLSDLRSLNLSSNRGLQKIDFVEHLSELETLTLSQSGVVDIRPVLQSGLPLHPGTAHFTVNGCASLEQPVTQDVIDELETDGVSTSVGSNSNLSLCPDASDYYSGTLTADLNTDQLSLDWTSDADDVVSCAVYYNLHAQQPRVMDAEITPCGVTGSETLTVDLDVQQVDLYINDGLFPVPVKLASTQVDSTNDSTQLRLAAVDWGQTTFKANPYLVPGRSALLRAHVIADSSATLPVVSASLRLGGTSDNQDFDQPAEIPAAPVFDSLDGSYQLQIPAEFMQQGLEIDISMDGAPIYTVEPTFADPNTLYLTVVPMVVDGVVPDIPSNEELARTIKEYWPIGEVVIERRSQFEVEDSNSLIGARDLLYMLRDLHAQEGAQHYYHGFFNIDALDTRDAAGVAFRPGRVGVTWDSPYGVEGTFAHELGHNFSVGHIDCGGPTSVEVQYPYAPEFMGSIGVNHDFSEIYGSEQRADVMSYCDPSFTSDWVYEKAQDHLTANPPRPFNAAKAFDATVLSQPTYSTYISGVIDQVEGNSRILSHFELNQAAGRENYGPFLMIATDSNGQKIERNFAIEQISESTSETNGYFNVRLPAYDIRDVQILYQGKEVLRVQL
ncbi:hypothetical protein CWE12_08680 [Aliidiomarina sedimenti]|uniref:Uncharacterized protein n=1 Tax=Aliidiomarina sedimenti TaxID=1933879 RepID=A0ABY0BZC8_9GAMM|nr:hypothetical protein [Aliidiomarina sedimenti]RUO30025.1 hypothetical protein CWE12_08680 [Aliidiomarina sedimenti]